MMSQHAELVIFPICFKGWTDKKLIWNQRDLLLLVKEKIEEMRVVECLAVCVCVYMCVVAGSPNVAFMDIYTQKY